MVKIIRYRKCQTEGVGRAQKEAIYDVSGNGLRDANKGPDTRNLFEDDGSPPIIKFAWTCWTRPTPFPGNVMPESHVSQLSDLAAPEQAQTARRFILRKRTTAPFQVKLPTMEMRLRIKRGRLVEPRSTPSVSVNKETSQRPRAELMPGKDSQIRSASTSASGTLSAQRVTLSVCHTGSSVTVQTPPLSLRNANSINAQSSLRHWLWQSSASSANTSSLPYEYLRHLSPPHHVMRQRGRIYDKLREICSDVQKRKENDAVAARLSQDARAIDSAGPFEHQAIPRLHLRWRPAGLTPMSPQTHNSFPDTTIERHQEVTTYFRPLLLAPMVKSAPTVLTYTPLPTLDTWTDICRDIARVSASFSATLGGLDKKYESQPKPVPVVGIPGVEGNSRGCDGDLCICTTFSSPRSQSGRYGIGAAICKPSRGNEEPKAWIHPYNMTHTSRTGF